MFTLPPEMPATASEFTSSLSIDVAQGRPSMLRPITVVVVVTTGISRR
jgi:hypothetical protein